MKRIVKYIFFFLLVIGIGKSFSQNSFQRSYGLRGDEIIYSVCESPDTSIVMVGVTNSYELSDKYPQHKKIYVVDTDSSGQLMWGRIYGGDHVDIAKDIYPTRDGGYIITGNTRSFQPNIGVKDKKKELLVLKINKNGGVEWSKTYGGENHDYGFCVRQTLDGGYIVAGETNSFESSSSDIYILKLDFEGNLQWSKRMGGKNLEYAFEIVETYDGYVLAGETNTFGVGNYDIFLMKIDKDGEVQWTKTYGGISEEYGYDLEYTADEGFVLTGSSYSFGLGRLDYYVLRLDKQGDILWSRVYGGESDDQAHSVKELKNGDFLVAGFSSSFFNQLNGEDVYVLRLSEKGSVRWSKIYGGKFGDYAVYCLESKKGDFLIAGETASFNGFDDRDTYVIRMHDDQKLSTCEQSRVQTKTYNIKFLVKDQTLKAIKTPTIEKDVPIESIEVLTAENIICINDMQVIESRDK